MTLLHGQNTPVSLFPNDLLRMILEMNNINELFHQNMTEFLQTDIDGSVDFSLNAITIQSLEKYLKTFYTPPLNIDQIFSIWDQILCNPKTMVTVIRSSTMSLTTLILCQYFLKYMI
jgi:hypothetical protein